MRQYFNLMDKIFQPAQWAGKEYVLSCLKVENASEIMKGDWGITGSMLCRIGIAALLGGLIGLEREKANQTAGLRTHILISLGAVLVMCTGEYIFTRYSASSSIDPARLGAQVVSGIGVLCAGTIMKEGSTIKGLTTATGLWCSACIGLSVGSGNVIPAAGVTLIVLVVLRLLRYLEKRDARKRISVYLRLILKHSDCVKQVLSWLREQRCQAEVLRLQRNAEGHVILYCKLQPMNRKQETELLDYLSKIEALHEMEILSEGDAA